MQIGSSMNSVSRQSPHSSSGPKLFYDEHGESISVFVEAAGLHDRPRLVKELRRHGATIAHTLEDAQVIIADRGTVEATQLANEWLDKPVLDQAWAYMAIKQGKMSGPKDNWGGMSVKNRVSTMDTDSEDNTCPLPQQSFDGHNPSQPNQSSIGTSIPPSHFGTPNMLSIPPQNASQLPQQQITINPQLLVQLLQQVAGLQIPLLLSQALMPALTQPSQPAAPSQPQVDAYSKLLEMLQSGSANISPPQDTSSTLQAMMQPLLISAIGNAAGSSGVTLNLPQGLQNTLQANQSTNQSASSATSVERQKPALPNKKRKISPGMSETTASVSYPKATSQARGKRRSLRTSPVVVDSDSSYAHAPLAVPPHSLNTGSSTGGGLIFTDKGEPMLFMVQVDLRNRKDVVAKLKKRGGRITPDIPLADYVVLSQQSASFRDLLNSSIAADKPTVQASFIHDCDAKGCLLDHTDPKYNFDGVPIKGKRGRPSIVNLAEIRKAMTGQERDLKPVATRLGKRQQSGNSSSPAPVPPQEGPISDGEPEISCLNDPESSPALSKKPQVAKKTTGKRKRVSLSGDERMRSPSPQPPHIIKAMTSGKNLYTEDDKEYFKAYVKHSFKYDPHTTLTNLTKELAQRAPHHSAKSWNSYIARNKPVVDSARKRYLIQSRKTTGRRSLEARTPSSHQGTPPVSDSQSPLLASAPSTSTRSPPVVDHDYTAADFDIVLEFFAEGGAEGKTDEEAWQLLQTLHPCRAASSWESFWDEHAEKIIQDLRERYPEYQQSEVVTKEEATE